MPIAVWQRVGIREEFVYTAILREKALGKPNSKKTLRLLARVQPDVRFLKIGNFSNSIF